MDLITDFSRTVIGLYDQRDAERVALAFALATIPYNVERVTGKRQDLYRFSVPVAMGSRAYEILRGFMR